MGTRRTALTTGGHRTAFLSLVNPPWRYALRRTGRRGSACAATRRWRGTQVDRWITDRALVAQAHDCRRGTSNDEPICTVARLRARASARDSPTDAWPMRYEVVETGKLLRRCAKRLNVRGERNRMADFYSGQQR